MSGSAQKRSGAVVAGIILAIGIATLFNGAQRIGQPFPGFLVAHNRIVVSIGQVDWSGTLDARIPFSQVVGVAGTSLSTATDIQRHSEGLAPGTPVAYRFRTGADVFDAVVPIRLFSAGDFSALYLNYFLVGAAFFAAGLWVLWRLSLEQTATVPFFILCQTCALALFAAGDVYGPYWFTVPYFSAHCIAPAAVIHFASVFPERFGRRLARTIALALLYGAAAALALALNLVANTPSLFLPLIYTVNLLLANSMLLYLGRLLISRSGTADGERRRSLDLATAALVLAASLPAAIFVVYPVVKGLISPLVVVTPFALFPFLTASALRLSPAQPAATTSSVRLRLSLLFLAAVETGFLAGIAYFWLSNSWQQLLADLSLLEQQTVRIEQFQPERPSVRADLARIESHVQSQAERAIVEQARIALEGDDPAAAGRALQSLGEHYGEEGAQLARRRSWLGRMDAALMLALVLVGVLQAVAFMVAVRRWLIQPIDALSQATAVIATGDLEHRSHLDSSAEFAALADSINTMAASLGAIQRRVDAERGAREQATAVARDSERRRLARELHDGVLQDLSAVKFAMEGEARRPESGRLQEIAAGLIRVIVSLRRVVDDLRPQELAHGSLGAAIETHAMGLARRHAVRLAVDVSAADEVADWAVRDVYRIAQEAVTNAIRHGAPAQVGVRLSRRDGHVILEVLDDGLGFDPQTVIRGGGLAGMGERAAALGAELEVVSQPGAGASIRLVLPASGRPQPPSYI